MRTKYNHARSVKTRSTFRRSGAGTGGDLARLHRGINRDNKQKKAGYVK